jgi:hypothetical protein
MTTHVTAAERVAPAARLNPLILDLLEWLATHPRPYSEVMEAWRTSCPRLTVWEDALDQGLVRRRIDEDRGGPVVALTPEGRQALQMVGRLPA